MLQLRQQGLLIDSWWNRDAISTRFPRVKLTRRLYCSYIKGGYVSIFQRNKFHFDLAKGQNLDYFISQTFYFNRRVEFGGGKNSFFCENAFLGAAGLLNKQLKNSGLVSIQFAFDIRTCRLWTSKYVHVTNSINFNILNFK